MSTLFLHCELCGRKQADGLLSRAAWGHVDLGNGATYTVCGPCKTSRSDWQERLRTLAGSAGSLAHRSVPVAEAPQAG